MNGTRWTGLRPPFSLRVASWSRLSSPPAPAPDRSGTPIGLRLEVTSMQRLPSIAPQQPDETIHAYGARALTFVLSTGVTATLADRDLELADMVAMLAVSAREISPPAL